MLKNGVDIVVIGGSAGCIPVICRLIESLPTPFDFIVVAVIHRSKNASSEMGNLFSVKNRETPLELCSRS